VLDLRSELESSPSGRGRPPFSGHEYVRGWGVFGLPMDSGHVLALRVFPENSFAPYRTVWHRDPEGRWAIHVDGPEIDLACPRYYGAACHHVGPADIEVAWTGPASLRVRASGPSLDLDWTVAVHETFGLALMNRLGRSLPAWSWRPGPLVRGRELLARHAFGLGDLRLSGTMPSGHEGVLMPKRMYWVAAARAVLNGDDLGAPTRLAECPTIGGVTVPARGVLAVGEAAWEPSHAGVRETLGLT
jgi:hypothetical protein